MPYQILDHVADAGVRGIGATRDEAFAEAARGMFSLMADLTRVQVKAHVEIEAWADTVEGLLVAWLGELLRERDTRGMLFSRFEVQVEGVEGEWCLVGKAWGERISPRRHRLGVEVKGATYSGVQVGEERGQHIAQCVVDL